MVDGKEHGTRTCQRRSVMPGSPNDKVVPEHVLVQPTAVQRRTIAHSPSHATHPLGLDAPHHVLQHASQSLPRTSLSFASVPRPVI